MSRGRGDGIWWDSVQNDRERIHGDEQRWRRLHVHSALTQGELFENSEWGAGDFDGDGAWDILWSGASDTSWYGKLK